MLERRMRQRIARAFRGRLLPARLRRYLPSSGTNAHGDPIGGTHEIFTFEGLRETFDARFRQEAGIPETDVAVLVLLGSLRPDTTPRKDDQLLIRGQWHQVRQVLDVDPANATARLQCYEIADPTQ